MKRISAYILFLFLMLSVALWVLHARSFERDSHSFLIVCTTGMIADAVQNIVHDRADVIGLMGPGVDPHLYRARESDVHKLSGADIIFYSGLHLEGRMDALLKDMNRWTHSYAVSDALDTNDILHGDFETVHDPHIWHSITLWKKVVRYISDAVCAYDSDHTDEYKRNAQIYLEKLDDTHTYIMQRVRSVPKKQRVLVTAHDAFSYFGKAYGFQVLGLQGMSTDAQVGISDVQHLVDTIVKRNISAVFIETSVPERNIKVVQDAAAARGHNVKIGVELFSDSLGDIQSGAHTYIGMMRHNIDGIVSSLN